MEITSPPRVVELPERPTLGIRVVTPFRGMLGTASALTKELLTWLGASDAERVGYGFLRLYVIDMSGPMDIEVGFVTRTPHDGDERVRPGVLLAGRYATLSYVNHSIQANRALIDWARDNELAFDRHDTPAGDAFACRYEMTLSDPQLEPRKTRWEIELAFKLA